MPISAFKPITPSKVSYNGTSASVGEHGKVTFTACTSFDVFDIFSSTYDNYIVNIRLNGGAQQAYLEFRLMSSYGTNDVTLNSYVTQTLDVSSTTLTASRLTSTIGRPFAHSTTQRDGASMYIFGPYLAQATAWRSTGVYGQNSGSLFDTAGTHNQAVSFTGMSLYSTSGSVTGQLTVYGCNQ